MFRIIERFTDFPLQCSYYIHILNMTILQCDWDEFVLTRKEES